MCGKTGKPVFLLRYEKRLISLSGISVLFLSDSIFSLHGLVFQPGNHLQQIFSNKACHLFQFICRLFQIRHHDNRHSGRMCCPDSALTVLQNKALITGQIQVFACLQKDIRSRFSIPDFICVDESFEFMKNMMHTKYLFEVASAIR